MWHFNEIDQKIQDINFDKVNHYNT